MPRTDDQISNLDAELDALSTDSTTDQVYFATKDYDQDVVAASAARRTLTGGGGGGGGWPVRDLIYGARTPKNHSGYGNISLPTVAVPNADGIHPFGTRASDNSNGSWIEWYSALKAGTYALQFHGYAWNSSGILKFSLNGTAIDQAPYSASAATIDTYAATDNDWFNVVVCSDLVIPASAVYVLRATVTGKNASSSGYITNITAISLEMTEEA